MSFDVKNAQKVKHPPTASGNIRTRKIIESDPVYISRKSMSRTNFRSNIRTKASKQLDPLERKANLAIERSSSHPREKLKEKGIRAPQNLYKVMHPYNRQRIKLPPPLSMNLKSYHL